MLYHFELQMAGVILLAAMAAGAVSLWLKRRRDAAEAGQPGGEPPGRGADPAGGAAGGG